MIQGLNIVLLGDDDGYYIFMCKIHQEKFNPAFASVHLSTVCRIPYTVYSIHLFNLIKCVSFSASFMFDYIRDKAGGKNA